MQRCLRPLKRFCFAQACRPANADKKRHTYTNTVVSQQLSQTAQAENNWCVGGKVPCCIASYWCLAKRSGYGSSSGLVLTPAVANARSGFFASRFLHTRGHTCQWFAVKHSGSEWRNALRAYLTRCAFFMRACGIFLPSCLGCTTGGSVLAARYAAGCGGGEALR